MNRAATALFVTGLALAVAFVPLLVFASALPTAAQTGHLHPMTVIAFTAGGAAAVTLTASAVLLGWSRRRPAAPDLEEVTR